MWKQGFISVSTVKKSNNGLLHSRGIVEFAFFLPTKPMTSLKELKEIYQMINEIIKGAFQRAVHSFPSNVFLFLIIFFYVNLAFTWCSYAE